METAKNILHLVHQGYFVESIVQWICPKNRVSLVNYKF